MAGAEGRAYLCASFFPDMPSSLGDATWAQSLGQELFGFAQYLIKMLRTKILDHSNPNLKLEQAGQPA